MCPHSEAETAHHHQGGPQAVASLTHFAYAVECTRQALATRKWPRVFVQARVRGLVRCGQVIECVTIEGVEFFKLRPEDGRDPWFWAKATNVRQCSGDGRCTCESA